MGLKFRWLSIVACLAAAIYADESLALGQQKTLASPDAVAAPNAVIVVQPTSETITYTYDVRGRLTKVAHSGNIHNGMVSNYSYDNADNRANANTTGVP